MSLFSLACSEFFSQGFRAVVIVDSDCNTLSSQFNSSVFLLAKFAVTSGRSPF